MSGVAQGATAVGRPTGALRREGVSHRSAKAAAAARSSRVPLAAPSSALLAAAVVAEGVAAQCALQAGVERSRGPALQRLGAQASSPSGCRTLVMSFAARPPQQPGVALDCLERSLGWGPPPVTPGTRCSPSVKWAKALPAGGPCAKRWTAHVAGTTSPSLSKGRRCLLAWPQDGRCPVAPVLLVAEARPLRLPLRCRCQRRSPVAVTPLRRSTAVAAVALLPQSAPLPGALAALGGVAVGAPSRGRPLRSAAERL